MPSGNPRQARLLLRRSTSRKSSNNIISECEAFLKSAHLSNLLGSLPDRQAPWEGMLKKALKLWDNMESIEDSSEDSHDNTKKATWDAVCKLIKATYSCQIKAPLSRAIQTQEPEEYTLHAAVGLTALRSTLLCPVIERLLRSYSGQLQVKEPVYGCLPLHVIASTMYQPDRCEILMGLLEAYPQAAGEKDDRGFYPLHLACQAKYPWKQGLESLYKMAPYVAELTWPCCPPELLAQQDCYDRSLDTVYALVQTDVSLFS